MVQVHPGPPSSDTQGYPLAPRLALPLVGPYGFPAWGVAERVGYEAAIVRGSGSSASAWRGRTTVKCRRSKVATRIAPCRWAKAITVASVPPKGMLA